MHIELVDLGGDGDPSLVLGRARSAIYEGCYLWIDLYTTGLVYVGDGGEVTDWWEGYESGKDMRIWHPPRTGQALTDHDVLQ